MRLNKYIANAGICSRRDADKLIAKGYVKVNGETITSMGAQVEQSDEVRFKGRIITLEKKVYVLLNKPQGYITTVSDPHHRRKVVDLVNNEVQQRIYPVGRLDKNTTGVLLLTNDGDLTNELSHPRFEVKKLYEVVLHNSLSSTDKHKIKNGISLSDGLVKVDNVNTPFQSRKNRVRLTLHSGRKRVIRRLFDHLNYKVKLLDRLQYAGLTYDNLDRGEWRYLKESEVNQLKAYRHVN